MNHADHVRLLQRAVGAGGVWADLGAGRGAFTLALAELLGPHGVLYAVDKDRVALRSLAGAMAGQYPDVALHAVEADFTRPLTLPPMDGIVMANALHYLPEKQPTVQLVRGYLKPGAPLVVIEYNTTRGNRWVPYPLTYAAWVDLAQRSGFAATELIGTHPSSFLGEFFAAMSRTADRGAPRQHESSSSS